MPGAQLPLETVRLLLEDAAAAKVPAVRLYGGEPLLHPNVVDMVRISNDLGVGCYMTTNAPILDKKIAALHAAGLRKVTIGYYGQDGAFDDYVQRPGRFARLIESLENTRAMFGPEELDIQMNFLLSRRRQSRRGRRDGRVRAPLPGQHPFRRSALLPALFRRRRGSRVAVPPGGQACGRSRHQPLAQAQDGRSQALHRKRHRDRRLRRLGAQAAGHANPVRRAQIAVGRRRRLGDAVLRHLPARQSAREAAERDPLPGGPPPGRA
ncbi:radical SAM protein [Sphingomonas endolithica]|uniref:radical SAM protein n=1 Tax=Sphingomonas endolithica TaxID=2972485 RepID=UPI003AAC6E75